MIPPKSKTTRRSYEQLQREHPSVAAISRLIECGMSESEAMQECICQLAAQSEHLMDWVQSLEAIRQRRVQADGKVFRWDAPDDAKLAAVRAAMEHQIKHPSLSGFGEILAIVKEPTNAE